MARPTIKPARIQTGFAINSTLVDKIILLKKKWGEDSLNDTYNRLIVEALKREKLLK